MDQRKSHKSKDQAAELKQQRLAQALRENLKKRKEQVRARSSQEQPSADEPERN